MFKVHILLSFLFAGAYSTSWNHIDQKDWPETCLKGKRQSPINLDSKVAVEQVSFEKFHFIDYHEEYKASVKNSGHSVELRLEESRAHPKVWGGGLPKEYLFDHLHFHWQSEHILDGYRFPLEVHLVHFAAEYKTIGNALNFGDGVAVLGVFYDLSPDDDIEFEPLAKVLEHIESNYNAVHMEDEVELRSFLPRDVAGFYRYNGSLTTPNCTEAVIWTTFSNTIPISKEQVKRFEALQTDSGKLKVNYRSLQDLGERTLYRKISPVPHDGSPRTNCNNLLILSILLMTFRLFE